MTTLTPPPVPQKLQEMLKDYPEHLERLQEVLDSVISKPSKATPPFEVAIWVLEARLETFIGEAREELKAAEASGDAVAIERAKAKDFVMGCARHRGMHDLSDLHVYFRANNESFE